MKLFSSGSNEFKVELYPVFCRLAKTLCWITYYRELRLTAIERRDVLDISR